MILTGGFDGFDVLTAGFDGFDVLTAGFDVFDDFDSWFWWFWCFDSRFWCFWWFWQEVFVFEGCIINDRRFWCFWQVVLMVLMFLTAGFDDFDRRFLFLMFWQQVLMILTGGFCFWRLYNKWQKVLMFLMILTGGFDGFDVFDSRFWWFWQKVFVFEGCILNHVIHTEGFVLWRRCYQEIPLPPTAYINGSVCSTSIRKRKHELHEHGLFIVP